LAEPGPHEVSVATGSWRYAEIGIRHVRGDLLVARRDELDPVARAVERIQHADIAVPADAEHVRDLVPPRCSVIRSAPFIRGIPRESFVVRGSFEL
jgi:hypothetical protein